LQIFNALNTLELKSLEEARYLLNEFAKHPLECLTLAMYTMVNVCECLGVFSYNIYL